MHFSNKEFLCKCGGKHCDLTDTAHPVLVTRLQALREEFGHAIVITSGVRCNQWNAAQGGVTTSMHLPDGNGYARAADIRCNPKHFEKLKQLLPKYFKAIGLAKGWFHVDIRDDSVRHWIY